MKAWLQPSVQVMAFIEGDTLIIKRLHPARLSQIAQRAPSDAEMSLDEIAEEVHHYRKEKHHASGS
jgi:chaperonin GroEL (HSP60 family)